MTPDTEDRCRDLLAGVEPPPAGMTVTDLLAAGRRARRHRRQWLATGVAAAATLGIGAVAGAVGVAGGTAGTVPAASAEATIAGTACTVQWLGLPPGATGGEVSAGSPNGRYLAGLYTGKGNAGTPVRWDGTRAERIPIAGIGEAEGVNDSGVVVGEGQAADKRWFAWAYAGGKVVVLPVPAGYTGAVATGVNAAGRVSGALFAGERANAAVWESPTATATVRVLEAPDDATAFGISDDGVVVGGLRNGKSPYRWDADGRGRPLPIPAGTRGGDAFGVRGNWAYGLATLNDRPTPPAASPGGPPVVIDNNVAVVWNLATGAMTTLDEGSVEAVTSDGRVAVTRLAGTAAIRLADGTERTLPAPDASGKAYVYALSDDGTHAGGSGGGSGDRPVRWSC